MCCRYSCQNGQAILAQVLPRVPNLWKIPASLCFDQWLPAQWRVRRGLWDPSPWLDPTWTRAMTTCCLRAQIKHWTKRNQPKRWSWTLPATRTPWPTSSMKWRKSWLRWAWSTNQRKVWQRLAPSLRLVLFPRALWRRQPRLSACNSKILVSSRWSWSLTRRTRPSPWRAGKPWFRPCLPRLQNFSGASPTENSMPSWMPSRAQPGRPPWLPRLLKCTISPNGRLSTLRSWRSSTRRLVGAPCPTWRKRTRELLHSWFVLSATLHGVTGSSVFSAKAHLRWTCLPTHCRSLRWMASLGN